VIDERFHVGAVLGRSAPLRWLQVYIKCTSNIDEIQLSGGNNHRNEELGVWRSKISERKRTDHGGYFVTRTLSLAFTMNFVTKRGGGYWLIRNHASKSRKPKNELYELCKDKSMGSRVCIKCRFGTSRLLHVKISSSAHLRDASARGRVCSKPTSNARI
jgi:hypothetical protein